MRHHDTSAAGTALRGFLLPRLVLLGLPALSPAMAAAQVPAAVSSPRPAPSPKAESKRSHGLIKLGPLYLTPGVILAAGIDNSEDIYDPEDTRVPDEAVTVSPSLRAVLPVTKYARARASGGLAPHYFTTEKSDRHLDRFGSVGANVDLGPLSVGVSRSQGLVRARFSLEVEERLRREHSATSVSAALRLGRTSIRGLQRVGTSTFLSPSGDPQVAALDRENTTRRLELRLPLTRRTTLAPSVDRVEDRFLRDFVGVPAVVKSERYRMALEFSEIAFLNGRVAAGLRSTAAGQGVAPYRGLFLEAAVSMPFLLGTRLALSANRDMDYALRPAEDGSRRNTGVNSLYRAQLSFELPWALHGRVLASYSVFDYLSAATAGPDAVKAPRSASGVNYGGALLRRFGSHVGVGGLAQRVNRQTATDGLSYSGWSYGLTGQVRF
jgi:hypothetical protein